MPESTRKPARLTVLDPGHFHAALLQKEMYPELDNRVSVYASLGPQLLDYLNRISLFNLRPANPTAWELDVHTSPDPVAAMLRDRLRSTSGDQARDMAALSGRNRGKVDRILASIDAGMHVLADKPWIITEDEMPKLEMALDRATQKGVAAYDIMTERYEVASQVQRALVNVPDVFGEQVLGDASHPGVTAMSVHHIMKTVAGVPLRRPVWFFDVDDYGEGLADVGTHPVDLIQWTMFPEQSINCRDDIRVVSGRHEAVKISKEQFALVTGTAEFPSHLQKNVRDETLDYFCNNYIEYSLRGVHVNLAVLWDWEAPPRTGDIYQAAFQGTRARVELRQGAEENFEQEVYIVPVPTERSRVFQALDTAMMQLAEDWPGITTSYTETEARIHIPRKFRVGHEEHFAQVARHFFQYLESPAAMPEWERSYMLAKYLVTTHGVALARK
jgi:predicted dehydrogenase